MKAYYNGIIYKLTAYLPYDKYILSKCYKKSFVKTKFAAPLFYLDKN